MKTIAFTITQEHIDKGIQGNSSLCAAARGMTDAGIKFKYAATFWTSIEKDGVLYSGRHSQKLAEFIQKFDDSGKGEPGTFTIDLLNRYEVEALMVEKTNGGVL